MLCYRIDVLRRPRLISGFLVYFTKDDQPTMLSGRPKQSKWLCLGQATKIDSRSLHKFWNCDSQNRTYSILCSENWKGKWKHVCIRSSSSSSCSVQFRSEYTNQNDNFTKIDDFDHWWMKNWMNQTLSNRSFLILWVKELVSCSSLNKNIVLRLKMTHKPTRLIYNI